ncbi:12469_t:CDS:2 [Ambispora gerdemannii]|uniref:12469_t:CDS:1 n=1 Tax=Ambispora gerdemannii TaxID=144530 RepID=A0A9N9B296_9GLOM|nr:12469_t:CDS:2 [Ambispora gerdemannii]
MSKCGGNSVPFQLSRPNFAEFGGNSDEIRVRIRTNYGAELLLHFDIWMSVHNELKSWSRMSTMEPY